MTIGRANTYSFGLDYDSLRRSMSTDDFCVIATYDTTMAEAVAPYIDLIVVYAI